MYPSRTTEIQVQWTSPISEPYLKEKGTTDAEEDVGCKKDVFIEKPPLTTIRL